MTSNAKRFSNSLSRLARDIDELHKDSHGLEAHDKLCNEQNELKRSLRQKQHEVDEKNRAIANLQQAKEEQIASLRAEISRLTADEQVLTRKYHARFKAWDAEMQERAEEKGQFSRTREERQRWKLQAETAQSAADQLQQQLDEVSADLREHKLSIKQLQRDLRISVLTAQKAADKQIGYERQLAAANDELGILAIDQQQCFDEIASLASRLHHMARSSFSGKLPKPEVMLDVAATASIRVPQMSCNSEAAAKMRCALAEAIIARNLSTYIFQDFYIETSECPKIRELTEILSHLDTKDTRKASIARHQVASALEHPRNKETVISEAVRSITKLLMPDSTIDQHAGFKDLGRSLTELFREALKIWQRLRRAPEHIIASVDVMSDEWDIDDAQDWYDTVSIHEAKKQVQGPALEPNFPIAVLFPQIWIGDTLLFHGHALFPSQGAVVAASLEIQKSSSLDSSVRRRRRSSNRGDVVRDPSTPNK